MASTNWEATASTSVIGSSSGSSLSSMAATLKNLPTTFRLSAYSASGAAGLGTLGGHLLVLFARLDSGDVFQVARLRRHGRLIRRQLWRHNRIRRLSDWCFRRFGVGVLFLLAASQEVERVDHPNPSLTPDNERKKALGHAAAAGKGHRPHPNEPFHPGNLLLKPADMPFPHSTILAGCCMLFPDESANPALSWLARCGRAPTGGFALRARPLWRPTASWRQSPVVATPASMHRRKRRRRRARRSRPARSRHR